MSYLALGALAVLFLLLLGRGVLAASPRQLRVVVLFVVLLVGGAVMTLLALTGRLGLAGAIGFLLLFVVRLWRELQPDVQAGSSAQRRTGQGGQMTRADALDVLGLDARATAEDIDAAYKKLMMKLHPDQGGTDALARQLNDARRVLLGD